MVKRTLHCQLFSVFFTVIFSWVHHVFTIMALYNLVEPTQVRESPKGSP